MSEKDQRAENEAIRGTAVSGESLPKFNKTDPDGVLKMRLMKSIHPCVDFMPEGVILGFRIMTDGVDGPEERQVHLVGTSDGFHIEVSKSTVTIQEHVYHVNDAALPPLLEERWDRTKIEDFLARPGFRTDLFTTLKGTIQKYLDLPSEAHQGLLASWIIATYFAQLFQALPFLHLLSPKETGKSKCLELIENTAFNAAKLKAITIPALGDSIDSQRRTILLDQAEYLPRNLVGILADSYKRAGAKREILKLVKGKRVTRKFSLFGPKAFASMRDIDPDLADRCCRIQLDRTNRPIPDFLGTESEWAELRDACYRFLLIKWRSVEEHYLAIQPDGTRRGELWRPMQAVMEALDVSEEEILNIQSAFQNGTRKTRSELSLKEEALFQVLSDKAEKSAGFEMTANELVDKMKTLLEKDEHPTPQWVGSAIKLRGMAEQKRPRTRKKHVHYDFRAERVFDLIHRYKPALEEKTVQQVEPADEESTEASGGRSDVELLLLH